MAIEELGIREPLAVWRPGCSLGDAGIFKAVGIYADGRTFFDIHVPDVHALVGVGNFLAVGRPGGAVEIGWRIAEADFFHFAEAGLIHDVESVISGFVGEKRD